MRESTSIFKKSLLLFFLFSACFPLAFARSSLAADPANPSPPQKEDEYSNTPFTEYGQFDQESEEESDTKFFQYGRFFGVSLGTGFEGIDGNRGRLWQGGFPVIDFKVHVWFDFNWALDLGVLFASHFFDGGPQNGGHVDVSLVRAGIDAKYYFETKNLSAPISFANPYLLLGGGSFTKSQVSAIIATPDVDTGLGVSAGAGLEFAIKPKKSYFEIEGKVNIVQFKDTNTPAYQTSNNIPDLTGRFYTVTGSILFTW